MILSIVPFSVFADENAPAESGEEITLSKNEDSTEDEYGIPTESDDDTPPVD